jgi:hypothetical protein
MSTMKMGIPVSPPVSGVFRSGVVVLVAIAAMGAAPGRALACACGCGVFEVGTSALLPDASGTTLFVQASYLDQSDNWSGTSSAPAADNDDKHLRTEFYTLGMQRMFNRDWGLVVELPYAQRHFSTIDDDTGEQVDFDHGQIGDIRLMGMYTGFSDDMSSGVSFGFKLANGNWKYPGFDRDTEIGTGSTDLLLGGYHEAHLGGPDSRWSGFAQALLDVPVHAQGGYRPGDELDAAFGAYPGSLRLGSGVTLTPILQALVSLRAHDSGVNADPDGTGYSRLLAAPGLELQIRRVRIYMDVEAPLWQNVRGDQLIAPWQAKLTASVKL